MNEDTETLEQFIHALREVYPDLTVREILEIFWLARHSGKVPLETLVSYPSPLPGIGTDSPVEKKLPAGVAPSRQPHPLEKGPSSSPEQDPIYPSTKGPGSRTPEPGMHTGYPIASPSGRALPRSLDIARSLRPLLRKVPSRTVQSLDEYATVQRTAETGKKLAFPVMQPALERWLDVALVVDIGASMIIWQKAIEEFRTLLENLGAFRNVYLWQLATDEDVALYKGNALPTPSSDTNGTHRDEATDSREKLLASHHPRELLDPNGQRLILVVTDCVSDGWHRGEVQKLLKQWGEKNIVTMVQMLPSRMWGRTALGYADIVQVHASSPGCINTRLDVRDSFLWSNKQKRKDCTYPVPIFTLQPSSSEEWANMMPLERSYQSCILRQLLRVSL